MELDKFGGIAKIIMTRNIYTNTGYSDYSAFLTKVMKIMMLNRWGKD